MSPRTSGIRRAIGERGPQQGHGKIQSRGVQADRMQLPQVPAGSAREVEDT